MKYLYFIIYLIKNYIRVFFRLKMSYGILLLSRLYSLVAKVTSSFANFYKFLDIIRKLKTHVFMQTTVCRCFVSFCGTILLHLYFFKPVGTQIHLNIHVCNSGIIYFAFICLSGNLIKLPNRFWQIDSGCLRVPRFHTDYYKCSPIVSSIFEWNKLDNSLRTASSLN